ncbi:hypothetical protein BC834DRAFT_865500 [Gloeopeniophorella convolvens]|nr:hypothetical protein BC834DRAFT_865500 [Gloeopeniophorella convolvens]
MQLWLVDHPTALDDLLYDHGLSLLDPSSCERVRRFYRRADACRCLVGRLLPRVLFSEHGVAPADMTFVTTDAGKPYCITPGLRAPLGYNVSHDSELVAMAFAPGDHGPPAFRIGVDVMKVQAPQREGFASFVHTVGDTLTDGEKRLLLSSDVPQNEALARFYLIWTIKEAYTKALGLGLGFDFRRIECDLATNVVSVDGAVAIDWRFEIFQVAVDEDTYQGTAVQFVGSGNGTVVSLTQGQIVRSGASRFLRNALRQLKGLELENADNSNK